jgi:inorganic pyrophosphatase
MKMEPYGQNPWYLYVPAFAKELLPLASAGYPPTHYSMALPSRRTSAEAYFSHFRQTYWRIRLSLWRTSTGKAHGLLRRRIKIYLAAVFIFLVSFCISFAQVQENQCTPQPGNPYALDCGKNFITDYAATNPDGSVNIVVEIPMGTLEKWEVMPDGILRQDIRDGQPRIVKYLGYPGNYGMVPKTLAGDKDPLDAIIIGAPPLARGSVVQAKIIGVLRLIDSGQKDDKIISVLANTGFYKVDSIEDLNKKFPGITKIVETWFKNYKGRGKIISKGYGSPKQAQEILNQSIGAYNKSSLR